MDEIINIQQNHNDGGSLLGKEGLIQLWKMINDNFISTDHTSLLQSKATDHAFVDNISSKLDSSKLTLTLPTYNLYTKTIGSVSAIIPAVSGSSAGLMTPTMLSTLNNLSGNGGGPVSKDDINKSFFTGVSKSGTDTVTLSFTAFNPSTKGTDTQTVSFDVGSSDSATKTDLAQCVKKSIIGSNQVISLFDISSLPNDLLAFTSGSDSGTLLLTFYGSKNGESQDLMGYRAKTTISAVSSSGAGLMTPALLNKLNSLSSGVDLTTADNRYIRKDISNAQEMSGTLTAPAFYMTSDIALKRDIIDTPLPDKIASRMIQFKQFKYKQDDDVHYGVIAQEVQKILPQLVHDNDGTKIVDYISLLCLKIQDLQDQINELKSEVSR